ncbi:hypothetical protein NBRC116583_20440 [Arenicella sp. 4NH20-0111]|uniref:3-keto-disaccharide hydrolase n=1 Tax=Arenicella sp. 4NH20-0111 TaxID=3127648 RepID=UPI003109A0A8
MVLQRAALVAVAFLTHISSSQVLADKQTLLDEELSKWDIYLSYAHSPNYAGEIPKDLHGNDIPPIGLNPSDGLGVFTVLTQPEPVLRVSGEYYGALTTKQEFDNYHFSLKVKWGDKIWPARKGKLKDTGILYHAIGPHGAEYFRSWMLSHEFQIMEGHMGDYWVQANGAIDVRAYPREYVMSPVADPRAPWLSVGKGAEPFVMRSVNHESPQGEWTQLDLISVDGQSLHIVNGQVVMALKNSRYIEEDGTSTALKKGKIQLQSEASEVFFKDIIIQTIETLPKQYAFYFE